VLNEHTENLMDSIKNYVVYYKYNLNPTIFSSGENTNENSHGISIYFPSPYKYQDNYREDYHLINFSKETGWDDVVKRYTDVLDYLEQ